MKRIAFVAHLSEVSGSGVALLETAAAFKAMGYTVFLIVPAHGQLAERAAARELTLTVIPYEETAVSEAASPGRKLRMLLDRTKFLNALRRFLIRNYIDLAYINSSANVFPGIAAHLAGVPIAWHIHETLVSGDKRAAVKGKVILCIADGLIYASKSGVDSLTPPPSMPYIMARNFVPVDALQTIRKQRLGQNVSGSHFIFMNGTISRKGADLLLAAVLLLPPSIAGRSVKLVIAGPPPTEAAFASRLNVLTSAPPLQGRVQFPGLLDSLAPELLKASVYISPSRNEALPIAIVEAMAAGVPVIATDVGDCADLLDYGRCGWVVPPENPEALAEAIHEALTHPELAAAKADAAFEKVKRLYGSESFWQPLVEFLESLMQR